MAFHVREHKGSWIVVVEHLGKPVIWGWHRFATQEAAQFHADYLSDRFKAPQWDTL